MRRKGSWSEATYTSRSTEAKTRGTATYEGEDRVLQGKGLDPLIDPSKYGVIRESNNLLVPDGKEFVLQFGVALPVETDLDTTGSMGGNVDVAFGVLPKVQDLLVKGSGAILKRYHTQIATGIIQDRGDRYPYLRSMFEPDNEVERQMGLLVPERGGGDATEDYQLGLFAAAYLTKTSIMQYGLKGYYFIVGDQRGRDEFDQNVLKQVFGPTVLEKAFGSRPPQSLPSIAEAAKKVIANWHVFFLQVGELPPITRWWANILGSDRVVNLPQTEDLAEVQACIIGLTEGVLDLRSAADFLNDSKRNLDQKVASSRIVMTIGDIPIGLQTTYSNFNRIPAAGSRFKSREDIWPISVKEPKPAKSIKTGEPSKKGDGKSNWKL